MATASLTVRPSFLSISRNHLTAARQPALLTCTQFLRHASGYGDRALLRPLEELDPNTVITPRDERRMRRAGTPPIGSRRRRAALAESPQNLPLEQMPYQCFQEAMKVLRTDREEKIRQIELERGRMARLRASEPTDERGKTSKQQRLYNMGQHLERLKIYADINDPTVKKRFEDKLGDYNRPIYRYLLDKKWRSYRRLLLMQRITQMNVVPDLLMKLDPRFDLQFAFGRKTIPPGTILPSYLTTLPPHLRIQAFDKGERLVTVAVMDTDVPDIANDTFSYRCHYLAVNIPVSPTSPNVSLRKLLGTDKEVLDWLPPHSMKGGPYHRLSILVLEQGEGHVLDAEKMKGELKRDNFNFRSFMAKHAPLDAKGVSIFRTVWDETMDDVMRNAGIEGADMEMKRTRIDPLPYKIKPGLRYR